MTAGSLNAFELPSALRSQGFALRPETDADTAFLTQLYASTRADELAQVVGWTDAQKRVFLESQFQAQRHHYRTHIPDCAFNLIEHGDDPAGRLYLDGRTERLHIVDIALVPAWRGKGIGTAILTALIARADESGRGVGIFVEKFNPALRLYRRLGFSEIADTGVYLEMEWFHRHADVADNGVN